MGTIVDYHGDKQREEEFSQSLEVIKSVDFDEYWDFKTLTTGDGLTEFNEFKEATESMVEEVDALKGSLYTSEGKKALIQENIDKLQQKYTEKEANRIAKEKEKLENLRNKLSLRITDASYYSPDTNQKLQDLELQTRSKIAFATHAREVESILKELVLRGEQDKAAAIFAVKYAYLFAEKASSLAKEGDSPASLHHIKTLIDKAENLSLNQKTKVRMEMLKRLENKGLSSGMSKRLIDMNAQNLRNKY
ncbi:hypothetical protein A1A1_16730 [Planococcus antarcticus DSM 14505]|uniref:Uncharacterized protein n=1 Tax=Planococcus antarcticus DSM 14505 TaxID=1185653 RepID=A0AA87II44_9BACL|nr:hypothetical protein [Planococcus antarcticus]EIM05328.1 hypothetical protein A1A1_16730 [Planococcus antarcticus DSM 14505]